MADLAVELQRDNENYGSGGPWGGIGHLIAFVEAWDAAPADPVVVAFKAIADTMQDGLDHRATVGMAAEVAAHDVLVALGYPDDSPRQENPT